MEKPKIITDSRILGGKPIIAGTRVSVSLVLGLVASGMSHEEILQDYPTLSKEAIQEALSFASHHFDRETILPIKTDTQGILEFPSV